jgi:hypothetical protein
MMRRPVPQAAVPQRRPDALLLKRMGSLRQRDPPVILRRASASTNSLLNTENAKKIGSNVSIFMKG